MHERQKYSARVQLEAMRDRYKSFHLERVSETEWKWYPVAFNYKNEIRDERQGESTKEIIFDNPHTISRQNFTFVPCQKRSSRMAEGSNA